jgi:hypothetical protein
LFGIFFFFSSCHLPFSTSFGPVKRLKRCHFLVRRHDWWMSKRQSSRPKKFDQGAGLEFDLSIKDATTNQEYVDENMVLPRGTRVIVQRLPAARGHGLLARMARAEAGFTSDATTTATAAAPSGFYTIDSRNKEDEEFVSTSKPEEEKELAALMAATDPGTTATGTTTASGGFRPVLNRNVVAGSGPPPPPPPRSGGAYYGPLSTTSRPARPNADPELREQERVPKKRATGIPRTFLNLSAPPVTDGSGEPTGETSRLLQPNTIGFEELVNRGGGQSETITGTKRDLDYALKLTSTDIPEHLQCGICHGVVKNAMLLPWDMEGRTACESCIRSALTESGFRCPLTGMEGVSPDDLHPNHGLRKAAELFVKGVMEKMDEITRQQVDEPDTEENAEAVNLEGESGDRGAIVSRRTMKDHSRKNDDDPFGGGDDDFGGDVFDVAPDEVEDEDTEKDGDGDDKPDEKENETTVETKEAKDKETEPSSSSSEKAETQATDDNSKLNKLNLSDKAGTNVPPQNQSPSASANDTGKPSPHEAPAQKRVERRRGPPAGYAMGPAGGAAVRGARKSPELDRTSQNGRDGSASPFAGGRRGRGDFFGARGGRGGRMGDRFHGRGGRFSDDFGRGRGRGGRGDYEEANRNPGDDESRGSKRSRSESEDFGGGDERSRHIQGRRGWSNDGRGRYSGRGRFEGRGRGRFEGTGGRFDARFDGGRGPFRGRGPPFRGGRGRGRY